MTTGGMKLVRKPRSAKLLYQEVRQEVKAGLEPIKNEMVNARKRVVSNWEHQPEFSGKIGVGPKQIFIYVTIDNKGEKVSETATIEDLWKWLDKTGTKAHDIPKTPKSGDDWLKFTWGGPGSYQSKTGAKPARYGGPGKVVGGKRVRFRQVNHPGFPARDFSGDINKDIKPHLDKAVNNAYKRGFRKISKK